MASVGGLVSVRGLVSNWDLTSDEGLTSEGGLVSVEVVDPRVVVGTLLLARGELPLVSLVGQLTPGVVSIINIQKTFGLVKIREGIDIKNKYPVYPLSPTHKHHIY